MICFDFRNKNVLITGGATGIGFAMARSFFECGANIVISGRREDVLDKAAEKILKSIPKSSNTILAIPSDMASEKSVSRLFADILNTFSSLDIVVNNAGVWSLSPILGITENEIISMFDNNVRSTILGTQAAARNMKRGGVIINMGSFAGVMAMKNASLYSSFKSSVMSFTRSAASEFAHLNIRVNCVIPGVIRTPMTDDYIKKNYESIIFPIPLKRVGKEEDVAHGVLFLASEYASYITGTCLEITGGKYSTQM